MFQYACVKALSLRSNVDCSFPEKDPNLHDIFNLSAKKVFVLDRGRTFRYVEPSFSYDELPATSADVVLDGYFQSEKYFSDCKDIIRKEFTFRNQSTYKVPSSSCSIHVRRGDYLKLQNHHPICDMNYYTKAMEIIKADNYLIFSDDPAWCSDNFKGDQFTVISGNSSSRDMQIMSQCDNHIIANSSFSWWGAWLNNNKNKIIYAPKNWFKNKTICTDDLIPKSWKII